MFGVFASRTHEIIEFRECMIQSKISAEIARFILDFINENNISVYDEKTLNGAFRHIIVKYGMKTGEVMCVFVLGENGFEMEEELVSLLVSKFPCIKTVIKNINMKNTNVILGEKSYEVCMSGMRLCT